MAFQDLKKKTCTSKQSASTCRPQSGHTSSTQDMITEDNKKDSMCHGEAKALGELWIERIRMFVPKIKTSLMKKSS